MKTSILAACFALLAFCGASCSWWSTNPEKLALDAEPSGSAPKLANIIKIDPPTKTLPDTPAATGPSDKSISLEQRTIPPNWLMLVGVLLLLFLLSLILFHSLGRRLGKRSFRVHAPTRHADIWASHKPPQFFDP
jgi:hypothetical protein